ncbi:hypothetical protein [Anaerobacillus arseniciselenatis]|uniref:hypothetical protein n=1 Tax=Anaerobacillus arseniciselenatis TaxID=85682 RepID=UPI001470D600|nr:hypothetical protein [Anaerobacillus arseniciselenatis]
MQKEWRKSQAKLGVSQEKVENRKKNLINSRKAHPRNELCKKTGKIASKKMSNARKNQ